MCLAVCRVPCARTCPPPRTRVSTVYRSAFADVALSLPSEDDPIALPGPVAFSLAAPSTVRISAVLTCVLDAPVPTPPWEVKATAVIARLPPLPPPDDQPDTSCTLSFTVFEDSSEDPTPTVTPLTLAAVRELPAGDYIVNLAIEAIDEVPDPLGTLDIAVSGELDVVVVRSALGCALVSQEFSQRTEPNTVLVAVLPAPLTPLTTLADFTLMHESCVLVTAPLALTLPHLGASLDSAAALRLSVCITAAPSGDTVYLSDAALTRSLYTGLDPAVGTYTVDATPTALTTLPRGTYTVQILGAVYDVDDTVPVTVSGDVNVLAVRTRISERAL
jgi:hypothetical protein